MPSFFFSIDNDFTNLFDGNEVKRDVDLVDLLMSRGISEAERFADSHEILQIMLCINWYGEQYLKKGLRICGVHQLCKTLHTVYLLERLILIFFQRMTAANKDFPLVYACERFTKAMKSLDNIRDVLLIKVHEHILKTK